MNAPTHREIIQAFESYKTVPSLELKFSYYENPINAKNANFVKLIDSYELIKLIKSPNVKGLCDELRSLDKKDPRYGKIKIKRLPYITPSNSSPNRELTGIEASEINGIISGDIDGLKDLTESQFIKSQFKDDPYIFLAFISPGGRGVKLLIRYNKANSFQSVFESVQEYFISRYNIEIDAGCSDLSRCLFLSHDPAPYYNEEPDIFNLIIKDETKKQNLKEKRKTNKNYDQSVDVSELISRIGLAFTTEDDQRIKIKRIGSANPQSGNMLKDGKLVWLWTDETILSPGRTYTPTEILSAIQDDNNIDKTIERLNADGFENTVDFFHVSEKGKVTISNSLFRDFLKTEIKILLVSSSIESLEVDPVLAIRDDEILNNGGHIIRRISLKRIKNMVSDWIRKNTKEAEKIESALMSFSDAKWNSIIDMVGISDPTNLKDTKDKSYFPFKNGWVSVNKEGIVLNPYDKLDGKTLIWKEQIINHNYRRADIKKSIIEQFIHLVSGGDSQAFKTVLGYLLSNFKNPTAAFAIVMSEDNDSDSQGGSTGKSLTMKCIGQMRKVVTIDGKKYKPDNNFLWQRVDTDSDLIFIDDVKKGFDSKSLHNAVTGGLVIEMKNKNSYEIPFEDSPKIVIATNYEIIDHALHVSRRLKSLLFVRHFGQKNTPEDHFGGQFFTNWDSQEWDRFFNSMLSYVQLYLVQGTIQSTETDRVKLKKIKQRVGHYGVIFIEFMDLLFETSKYIDRSKAIRLDFQRDLLIKAKKNISIKITKPELIEWIEFYCQKFDILFHLDIERRSISGHRCYWAFFNQNPCYE